MSLYINENKQLELLVSKSKRAKLPIYKIPKETHGRLASLLYALKAGKYDNLSDVHNLIRKDQKDHIEKLQKVLERWRLTSPAPIMSVETMIRVVATLSKPRVTALRMINAAPMNLNLGNALREVIPNHASD